MEFTPYRLLERQFLAKIQGKDSAVLSNSNQTLSTLNALILEMELRLDILNTAYSRNITEYNKKFQNGSLNPVNGHRYLPHIILVIDELADIQITNKAEINRSLERLLMTAYKVGIFIILSTNQVSRETLSTNMKSLFEKRIIFKLNDKETYRSFIDTTNIPRFQKKVILSI